MHKGQDQVNFVEVYRNKNTFIHRLLLDYNGDI